MTLIDWHCRDPTPGQQLRALLSLLRRSAWFHVLWAREALTREARLLAEDIHAWYHMALGRPDPREFVTLRLTAEALRFAKEADAL